jgi:regulation of enolase protein 1 (concanavalin A-like superfamily)
MIRSTLSILMHAVVWQRRMRRHLRGSLLLLAWCLAGQAAGLEVTICRNPAVAPHLFAGAEIKAAVSAVGGTVTEAPLTAYNAAGVTGTRVILAKTGDAISGWNPLPAPAVPQAYAIRVRQVGGLQEILVMGNDATGTQYGGLDVAEAVSIGTLATLAASDHAPKVSERGIKLNIPLDARNPSYSDVADAAQASMADVWDLAFWRDYLDEMARQRLNTLSLWNLHPFTSMVTVPEFPAAALSDVVRTKVPYDSISLRGQDVWDAASMGGAGNLETIKVMTPAQKTAFWNTVLDMAEARGVSVYIFTWNIYTDGLEGNPYGIKLDTETAAVKQGSAVTKQYYRCSIRTLLTSLPKLAGIGITGGEEMDGTAAAKEAWLADTYGEGMNDVKVGYTATAPGGATTVVPPSPTRPLRLIQRLHEVTYSEINNALGKFKNNLTIDTSHKYSVAHTFCSTKPTFKLSTINSAPPEDQVWLTVRFDDQYNARWGDADFVRSWVNNLPSGLNGQGEPKLKGFYMGPDGYTWARRTNAKGATGSQLDIRRWWYTQQLFGRLSYEPTITNAYFDKLVAARLNISQTTATSLNTGLARASRITPLLLRYHFAGGNDYVYFPEGCRKLSGFLDVENYMDNSPIGSGDGNGESPKTMQAFCTDLKNGITPAIDTGARLEAEANAALSAIAALTDDPTKPEYNETLADIRIMAAMGKYYAAKFRGARDLMLANTVDTANATTHRANAVAQLTDALAKWKTWAGLMAASYHPTFLGRVGVFDLMAYTPYAANDIARAAQQTSGGPTVQTQPKLNSQTGATASLSVLGQSTSDSESQLTYHWFLDATRPAPVTYSTNFNNAAKNVTVTFAKPGRYVFKVIILDSRNRLVSTNDLLVTQTVGNGANAAPTVYAGLDRVISLPAAATLSGSVNDDGLPASASLSATWSKVSGPGTVTFTAASSASSSASFSALGTYVLRLTANDGALSATDEVTVTVLDAGGANLAPNVDAGPDATISLPAAASLAGIVDDDGQPTGTVTVTWTKVSGPGTVNFANATAPVTTASFSAAGTYVLRLLASDTQLSDDALVTITVQPDTTPLVTFTLINADSDLVIAGYDPLASGTVLNLAQLPTRNLAIRANAKSPVGSMRMVLSGTQARTQTESTPPYSLFGGTGSNYAAWTPAVGPYTLVGTSYSGANASGTVVGTTTITFTVTDQATSAPVITTQPTNQTAAVGQTATFNVVATGTPTLTYQWQKGTTNILGATSASYTTPVLTAFDLNASYRCVVSNSAGSVTSASAIVRFQWSHADIGAVAAPGSDSESGGIWTVQGSGADIWLANDEFHFVWQPVSGDVSITARVLSLTNTNAWAKAGVMLRATQDSNSAHAFTCVTPQRGVAFQRRLVTAGASSTTAGPAVAAPYWVRLERFGNLLVGSSSPDGVTWTEIRRQTITLGTNILVGLAVTSHNDGAVATATFGNVQIISAVPANN